MKPNILFLSLAAMLFSCSTPQRAIQLEYKDYEISKSTASDTSVQHMLQPYGDSVNKAMNKVIGFSTAYLQKKQPEGPLGNFMADAMRTMAAKKFATDIDIAFVNYGGVRGTISKGDITIGNIYELMPFDNLIVLQKIRGNVLHEFLNHTASRGGWPCAGITMTIKDKQAVNILINGKPLDEGAVYVVANSDYVANGGDNSAMLRTIPQMNKGYLFRDALLEYVQMLTQQGKPVSASIEGRVKSNGQLEMEN